MFQTRSAHCALDAFMLHQIHLPKKGTQVDSVCGAGGQAEVATREPAAR